MIESQRVASFVFDTLKNDATFAGFVGSRVYRDQVPQNAALPAAIVSVVSGTDSATLGGTRVFDLTVIDVHLVGPGASYGPLNPAADRADALLQGGDGTSGGVVIVKLRRDGTQAYLETDAGVTFAHLIQTYRSEAHAL